MSLSRPKDKLRHYKSLQNLHVIGKQSSAQKKSNKNINQQPSKSNKIKKYSSSRFPTEINQKIIIKEQNTKFSRLFKSQPKTKKEEKKIKTNIKNSNNNINKKHEKNKVTSPINRGLTKKQVSQFEGVSKGYKKQKKNFKKQKCKIQNQFHKSTSKIHGESIFMDKKSKNSHEKSREGNSHNKSKKKLQKYNTQFSLQTTPSCGVGDEIQIIDLVGQGTFGKVFRGKIKKTNQIIAIKRVLQDSRYKNREIDIIRILKNDFIVQVLGSYITYDAGLQYLNIMMKYYDENLFKRINFYKQTRINNLDTKIILYQIFKGLTYLHSLGVCHRDIKPENILLKGSIAVICDFGSAKILTYNQSNISYICARCYRAPELIFGSTKYSTIIDIWSAGCVILQLLNGQPLFIGETSINHLLEIVKILGTPTKQEIQQMNPEYNTRDYNFPMMKRKDWKSIFPSGDELLLDLLDRIMVYSPVKRYKAIEVLAHDYFNQLRDKFTYQHIRCQFHLKDFFKFTEKQLSGNYHLLQRIIPTWYHDNHL